MSSASKVNYFTRVLELSRGPKLHILVLCADAVKELVFCKSDRELLWKGGGRGTPDSSDIVKRVRELYLVHTMHELDKVSHS